MKYDYLVVGAGLYGAVFAQKAKEAGKTPKQYVDEMAEMAKELWAKMDIQYSDFIRTTEPRHVERVQKLFMQMYENGDIYNVYHYWPETSGVGGRITGINKTRFSPTESGEFRLELYAPSLAPQEYPNN